MNLSRIQLVSNLTLARFEHEFRQSQYFTFCFKVMIEWRVFFHAVRWKTVAVINGRRQDCRANGLGVKLHDKTKTRKHSCLCHIPHMMIYYIQTKGMSLTPKRSNTSLSDARDITTVCLSFTPVKEIGHNAIRCKGHWPKRQVIWVSPQRVRTHRTFQQRTE